MDGSIDGRLVSLGTLAYEAMVYNHHRGLSYDQWLATLIDENALYIPDGQDPKSIIVRCFDDGSIDQIW
jgi:hypothetical protein